MPGHYAAKRMPMAERCDAEGDSITASRGVLDEQTMQSAGSIGGWDSG